MLNLNACPTTNTLPWDIALLLNGQVQATVHATRSPNDPPVVLTVTFDEVRLVNTPRPDLRQISPTAPNQNYTASPGCVTHIAAGKSNTVVVTCSPHNAVPQNVIFS